MNTSEQINSVAPQSTAIQAIDGELNLLDLLEILAENIRLLVVGPLLVGLVALAGSFFITPVFTSETVILPPQQQQSGAAAMLQSLGALGGLAGSAAGLKSPNDQYVAMLKSRNIEDALIDHFKLQERWEQKYKQDTRNQLKGITRIANGKDGLITISVDDESPQMAADIANAYVQELGRLVGQLAVTEAQQRRMFFEQKLKSAQAELIKAEQALRTTGVSADLLKTQPGSAVAGIAELEARISAQEVKIASMRGYMADTAPDFRQAQTELSAMRQQQAKLGRLDIGKESKSDYIQRFRDFKYQETMVDLFTKQYEVARIDESRDGPLIQVIDVAQPAERKSKPKKALIAVISTLAAGFLLLIFIFGRNILNNLSGDAISADQFQRIKGHIFMRRN